jgi:hypothetical protein
VLKEWSGKLLAHQVVGVLEVMKHEVLKMGAFQQTRLIHDPRS